MTDIDRPDLLAEIFAADIDALPPDEQQAFRYLLGRLSVEAGAVEMMNDLVPEGGMNLVLREKEGGRPFITERPTGWSREEEERHLSLFRRHFAPTDPGTVA